MIYHIGMSNKEINYQYDFANRLVSATHPTFGIASYTYDEAGNRKTIAYPNGMANISYDYNEKNRIVNQIYKDKNSTVISSVNYTYYENGNRKTMTNELGKTEYFYDNLDQIVTVQTPRWGTQSYTYDNVGNRKTFINDENENNKSVSYNYDELNQLKIITENNQETTFDYDGSGNCTRKGSMSYEWNYLDQLVKVKKNDAIISEFTYDHSGRRIQKKSTVNGQQSTVYYYYDGLEPIIELDGSGNVVTEQFGIGSELVCSIKSQLSSIKQLTYHLNDHLGSTIFVLDSAGNLLANHYHDPFGKVWNVKGDIRNDIRFTDKEYEEDIGLYYFAARWYDPDIGRFVSQDPIEPLVYIYTLNNPMKYTDPTGFWNLGDLFKGVGDIFKNIGEALKESAEYFEEEYDKQKAKEEATKKEEKALTRTVEGITSLLVNERGINWVSSAGWFITGDKQYSCQGWLDTLEENLQSSSVGNLFTFKSFFIPANNPEFNIHVFLIATSNKTKHTYIIDPFSNPINPIRKLW